MPPHDDDHPRSGRESSGVLSGGGELLGLLPMAVYTCDAPSGVITFFNEQAAALWGRAPRLGETDERFCGSFRLWRTDGTRLPHDGTPMALAIREGRAFRNEDVVVERPDGTRINVLVNVDPVRDAEGRVIGAINAFHDTTALKRAQESIQEADRRKDEFLATLAHELRNPLAPLRNGLEVMRLARSDPETAERCLSMMERQLAQLTRLVEDLLDISRITRGTIELRKEIVELAAVVEQAIETTRPLFEAADHEVAVRLPPEPIFVDADFARLAQVVGNLLGNAAKYTERGGRITLEARREGDDVVTSVRDTGLGIPAHMLSQVFEMFAQVDGSLERAQGGLGVGLTLVRQLVEMHGGSVEARSRGRGTGSEFVIRLPAAPAVASPRRSEGGDTGVAAMGRRILVVDDNPDVCLSLSMMLKLKGHEIQTACDGLDALDVAEAFRPDVILLDIGMPKLNGYDVATRLRQRPWGRHAVLVALTGWGQADDRRRSEEAGFDAHLVKPVEPAALARFLAGLADA